METSHAKLSLALVRPFSRAFSLSFALSLTTFSLNTSDIHSQILCETDNNTDFAIVGVSRGRTSRADVEASERAHERTTEEHRTDSLALGELNGILAVAEEHRLALYNILFTETDDVTTYGP